MPRQSLFPGAAPIRKFPQPIQYRKQRSASDNTYFKNKDSIITITKPYITELSISLAGINIGQNSSRNQSSKVQEVGIHLHEYWPGSTATG
jgi:hypothetical protein